MPEVKTAEFPRLSRQSLADPQVQSSLRRLSHFIEAREAAVAEVGEQEWQRLRDQGRRIKEHAIAHLDYYLELAADNVVKAGGNVCFARDAREACDYVLKVAQARRARTVIKSKSMVSEETGINTVLESHGIRPVETDLGEYIIQLAGETPFHIVAPALHKSKEEVADLFVQKLNVQRKESITELTAIARAALREIFVQADIGMTGANFVVAETGTVVIVTNEGNGRMSTSLPRVHIALMGMERVVPRLEDMAVFLRLLPRSATGQRLTSYTTFVTGPRRDDEEDGPDEFHLVILDNGRSRMLADEALREALYCIRCGAWVYGGPIGAVVTPILAGLPQARHLPFASTLCGACREVCPVKINIPHLLLTLRSRVTQGPPADRHASWLERIAARAWQYVVTTPWAFGLAGRAAAILQLPLLRRGRLRWLPQPLNAWTRTRDFPRVAFRPFRARWSRIADQHPREKT
ncbi:MAG: lactate utilization protein [Chloroflexi bacterium]|nr:lactate utilization protein [Chloroflexota bacterium]